ncbi:MAG: mechanosensitive ion channel family protein [Selenomonadaceae bacterium]|nr:mechanosensitive ion channel family protein [Selenomonadaceae bacterium]
MSLESIIMNLVLPLVILAVAASAGIMLNRLLTQKIEQNFKFDELNVSIKSIFLRALRGVPISLCLVIGLYWIVNTSALPVAIAQLFSYILFTVIVFSLTRVTERTISGFISLKMTSAGQSSQSTLLEAIFKTLIYASGALIILQYYGISIAPILTAMGVGGMAVALGLQETLANIFSGLQLILSKQLKINDYIRLQSGEEGKVTDISWRYTTIMPPTEANVVVVPNKTIAASITSNFSRPREDIVVAIPIGVSYDSDLEQVERVTVEVAREVMMEIDKYKPQFDADGKDRNPLGPAVRFHTFGDSSIDFNAIIHSSNFSNQFLLKHEFIKRITVRYRKEGIEIPFPIRTLNVPNPIEPVE